MTEHTPLPDAERETDFVQHLVAQIPLPDGLTDAERETLRRIVDEMEAEIGDDFTRADLEWLAPVAFAALARLIRRTETPLAVPDMGTFRRHPLQRIHNGQIGRLISFQPDPLLLETAL